MQNSSEGEFQYSGQSKYVENIPQVQSESKSGTVQWKASEFIEHQKSTGWFTLYVLGAAVLGALMFAITRDILSTLAVIVAAIAFGFFARQKPRTLTYTLLPTSIKIGQRVYNYDDFKTFSLIKDGAIFSILLEPVKRFMPPLTIYFDQADGEKIFDVLASHLPHQDRDLDFVDKFMRKIRF